MLAYYISQPRCIDCFYYISYIRKKSHEDRVGICSTKVLREQNANTIKIASEWRIYKF